MRKIILFCLALVMTFGFILSINITPIMAAEVNLKLAHFMPTVHVQHRKAFVPFSNKVAELTGGKVEIKIFPGGTLGNPKTLVDSIRTGITDIAFIIPAYIPGRFPRTSVFELPLIFEGAEHVAKVGYDIYDKYLAEDYKDFKFLWLLSSPLGQLHTVKAPVLSAADFKGKKIRTAGAVETDTIKRLGGNPVSMPISELSMALQKGVVDGAVTPYAALRSFKLIDLTKHLTEINHSGAFMAVLMNKRKWNSLPAYAKEAIDKVATREFGLMAAAAFDQEDIDNIKMGKAKGIQFHKLPAAEMEKVRATISEVYAAWVKKNERKFSSQELFDAVQRSAKANR